jgi:hypothetical protein
MIPVLFGIFFILHAFVHLLYAGQALRIFELRPGLTWPDGAWLFSRLFGEPVTRRLAAISLLLTALGLIAAGLGLFFRTIWWQPTTIVASGLSVLIYLLFWDGKFHDLPDQGGLGILIDLGILLVVILLKQPL